MAEAVKDKLGEKLEEGDYVEAKSRGGKHAGEIEQIVTTEEEAKDAGAKNPPKVLYTDQHGHNVSHNPETVVKGGL